MATKRTYLCSACGQPPARTAARTEPPSDVVSAGGANPPEPPANTGPRTGPPSGVVSAGGANPPEWRCRNLWCTAPDRSLEAVFAVGNYEGALRKAIVSYKYRWDLRWARPFGALLYAFLMRHATWFEEYAVICPVPQFMGPGARRPWAHVGLVCAEVSRLAGGGWPVEDLVTKVFETDVMSSKPGPGRRELARKCLRQAFIVSDARAVEGRRILLVDDVCASGYTLLTVARALRRAGAEEVAALVLARARWRDRGVRVEGRRRA